jgi:hypothetical protein
MFTTNVVGRNKTLIARHEGILRKSLVLAPGQGDLADGTVVFKDADGLWRVAATGQLTDGYDVAVMEDAVATGLVGTGSGFVVNALFAGTLVGASLVFASGTTLTAAIARVLRDKGIHLTGAAINADGEFPETYGGLPLITIATQPQDATVAAGAIDESLSVVASASDGAAIAYQWVKPTTNSNAAGTPVSGATSAIFPIPTDLTAGTHYFYCILTAQNATLKSAVATVTVTSD